MSLDLLKVAAKFDEIEKRVAKLEADDKEISRIVLSMDERLKVAQEYLHDLLRLVCTEETANDTKN